MKVKSLLFMLIASLVFSTPGFARSHKKVQKKANEGYHFTDEVVVPHTSVKNQYRSGTCWDYSGLGLVEAELLRTTGKKYDLSEMFNVYYQYSDRATKYVRLHGKMMLGPGGETTDVLRIIKKYGMVPDSVYSGMDYGTKLPVQSEMDNVLQNYVDDIVSDPNHKLTPVWHKGFDAVITSYLGPLPKTFNYEGKTYTPQSFRDMTGFNPDDIIPITSFMDHPYYTKFALAIPDNWTWAKYDNVPMKDLLVIINNALKNGYCLAWDTDVSNKGFNWKKGVAFVPDEHPKLDAKALEEWNSLRRSQKEKRLYKADSIVQEATITPQLRQKDYDNYLTQDDHLMLIVGIAHDQKGDTFYKVKNSWGTDQIYHGYIYVSAAYIELNTLSISVNKAAIPAEIREKMGIK
ncbi:MAG: aminopeptidase [Bacteroidales bacterium]|nr:aminopeptidase [Bacteroidales bacterium]